MLRSSMLALAATSGLALAFVCASPRTAFATESSTGLAATHLVDDDVRTLPVDPVALAAGEEVAGLDHLSVTRDRYRYVFANETNKAAFLRNPEQFEIQLGGGCGRMGPLSGEGRMDLFASHKGRVYIFASEGCRETFLAKADALLETDDERPVANADTQREGAATLARAVKAHGGAEAIDAIRTLRYHRARNVNYSGTDYVVTNSTTFALPDRIRTDTAWNDDSWSYVTTGTHGHFMTDNAFDRPMVAVQRKALARELNRDPITVLKARHRGDFVVASAGTDTIDGQPVHLVETWFNGTKSTLAVSTDSNAIVAMRYRARGFGAEIGDVEVVFSDHREINGVVVPMTRTTTFNGQPFKDQSYSWTEISIDADLPDDFWLAARP